MNAGIQGEHDKLERRAQLIRGYAREGFCFPFAVLTPDEVEHYRNQIEALEDHFGGRIQATSVIQPHLHLNWARELATHPAILAAVDAIIGPDILVHSSTIFCKYPDATSRIPFHQDGHYWRLDKPLLVSAWVALTPSRVHNGCLRVVPRSQDEDRPHVNRPSPDHMLATGMQMAQQPEEEHIVDIELDPGEMSLHHVNLVHGSSPNHSREKRLGYAIRYVAADVVQALPHHPVLLAQGQHSGGSYTLWQEPYHEKLADALSQARDFGAEILARRLNPQPAAKD